MATLEQAREAVNNAPARSAWAKGVKKYALELLEEWAENHAESEQITESALLNGADNWSTYSWGGCSLIYNANVSERLCAPFELKKTKVGERRPNAHEEWLDTQARALAQAARLIL